MINRQALLSDLQKLLKSLEADLLERSNSAEVPEVGQTLRDDYETAKNAQRTAQNYEDWRSDYITQVAAAWVLSCVFVRFLEDNQLVDLPKISGPGDRLQRARDEHELFFAKHPKLTDREYLLSVFDELAKLPGTKDVFGKHNPVRELPNWLSGDAAGELLRFFQKIEANTGHLIHDFTDPAWGTRFLGDLYQDLSEAARKKFALLQTPEFVEEFILERTLEPALDEFGLDAPPVKNQGRDDTAPGFRMIDPACGSGHFLLGAFHRILNHWQKKAPGEKPVELVLRTLQSIHGVDLNPYAVAIARFRLIVAAMQAAGIRQLAGANFPVSIACGDSLLHGVDTRVQKTLVEVDDEQPQHAYWVEDRPLLRKMLIPRHYHAVVANPPYITPKDRAANEEYRRRYDRVCHMKYSLAVPFFQRLFDLATAGGYVGQITANSFMKREFGKKLIEQYLPTIDLTHVIDTSGAYIPGHGTPTVILFGRQQKPIVGTLRTVMGIRGEPSTPADPAHGLVWTAIVEQIDLPGSQSEFVSVGDSTRDAFHKHPWSIGGGGAAELKEQLEVSCSTRLDDLANSIGFASFTGQDDAFVGSLDSLRRSRISSEFVKAFVVGDTVRDWQIVANDFAFAPYDALFKSIPFTPSEPWAKHMWPLRTAIGAVISFGGKTRLECGDEWWTWYRWIPEKYLTALSITYGEVATHNHFVLDRGGKVFKQTAPVIKLPPDATEDDHLALLGLLNSSTACFWLKQVCHNKGSTVDQHGARQRTAPFEDFYAFNATKLQQFPVVATSPIARTRQLDQLVQQFRSLAPAESLTAISRERIESAHQQWNTTRARMISLQEELDWECYRLYGLTDEDLTYHGAPPSLELGERPFEIFLARQIARGEVQTTWFERHNIRPVTEPPSHWPADYLALYHRRHEALQSNPNIALIEQPEYKRRWSTEPWESQLERALRDWLLNRLESYFDFNGRMNDEQRPTARLDQALVSVARLADVARQDPAFQQVGELYRDDPAFDIERLVAELVEAESVPLLPVLKYKESGLRKRAEWERTWELQREEDDLERQRAEAKVDLEQIAFGIAARNDHNEIGLFRAIKNEFEDALERLQKKYAPDLDTRYMLDPLDLYAALDKQGAPVSVLSEARERYLDAKKSSKYVLSKLCDADLEYQDAVLKLSSLPSPPKISVPPKYTSADFQKSDYWRLRGKLDVPKERWVSFPHCEGPDGTLMIAWAGYDHLQLARAISAYFVDIQERLGGRDDPRLIPLLACIIELLPWLKQWHNEVDREFGVPMGDYFQGFLNEEARGLGMTLEEIKRWEPAKKSGRRARSGLK